MVPNFCVPLHDCRKEAEVGGKAANLGFMIRRGIPVPHGFALKNSAFQHFCKANSLQERISTIRQKIDHGAPASMRFAADRILDLVLACEIPKEIWDEVSLHAQAFGSRGIIVRSSAIGEDTKTASFAGQLDSITALDGTKSLRNSLLRCWASFWSERTFFYQRQRGVWLKGMGVIIQQLVDSKVAGVLFTRAPNCSTGSIVQESDPMLVEYVFGRGEELVSGRRNPGRIVVSRTSERWEKLADPEDETHEENDLHWISSLRSHALELEKLMGHPQDIEWAVDPKHSLYLLQSRPITGVASGDGGSFHDKVLWSNVNVNENYPEPISPLLYSIALKSYYHYFRNLGKAFGVSERRLNAMENPLSAIIGTQGARMYYNLTNIYRVICVLPFGKHVAGFFDSFVGVNEPLDPGFKDERFGLALNTMKEIAEVVRMASATFRTFLLLPWRIRSLETLVDRYLAECAYRMEHSGKKSKTNRLIGDFRRFLDIRFHQWRKAALADVASVFTYGLLKSMLGRALGKEEGIALHHTLLKGIPHLVSSRPLQKIWDLAQSIRNDGALMELFRGTPSFELERRIRRGDEFPEFGSLLERFLQEWGYRCSGELMLTVPNFREKPSMLFDILKGYIETEIESPESVILKQEKERKRVLKDLRPRMSVPEWVLLKLLIVGTHHSIAYRERVRMKQAALYAEFRQTVLGLGRFLTESSLIEEPEDIFFLKYHEINDFFAGTDMLPLGLRELIRVRKEQFEEVSRLRPPDYLLLSEGEYYDGTQADFRSPGVSAPDHGSGNVLYGIGACGGRATGKARVLESVLHADQLKAGEILVTRQTDPGWGPVFPLIRGLVMERGGMLSHGAIIAREFGIPAVVGIPKVTDSISTGQTIVVDGDKGYVMV